MTLVVVRLLEHGPRFESDSHLTDVNGLQSGMIASALKAVVLHRGLCVAYAGLAETALIAIRGLAVSGGGGFDVREVERRLLDAHNAAAGGVDFLVGSLSPTPSISRVSRGVVERGLPAAWIGDHEAFVAYQRGYHEAEMPKVGNGQASPLSREDVNAKTAMRAGMAAAIEDSASPTVAGLPLAVDVSPDRYGFSYVPEARMEGGADQKIPSREWTTLQFGGTAEGGFAYSVLVPDRPGIGVLGIHIRQGQLGMLFYPQLAEKPVLFRNVSHVAFESEVKRLFGVAIRGPMIS